MSDFLLHKSPDKARIYAEPPGIRYSEELRRWFVTAERFADGGPASGPGLGSLFDHRRTWRYRTTASPEACVEAFVEAFSTGGGIVARAKWDIERTPDGAVATYAGRKGAIGLVSALSATAQAEEEGALGSEVRWDGQVACCAHRLVRLESRRSIG